MPEPVNYPTASIQLYSVHAEWQKDSSATLAKLAEIGLTTVEAFDFVERPAELADAFSQHGLTPATGHALFLSDGNEQLTVLPLEQTLEAAATLGVQHLIDPFIEPARWSTFDAIQASAERMNKAVETARHFGIGLGYHNHGHELFTKIDGRPALEVFAELVDPSVAFEVDLFWAANAGVDAVQLVKNLGERVLAVHVKDGGLNADVMALKVPDGQTIAGQGEVPLALAIDQAPALQYAIIEFDRYDGDIFDGVRGSYEFLTTLGIR